MKRDVSKKVEEKVKEYFAKIKDDVKPNNIRIPVNSDKPRSN